VNTKRVWVSVAVLAVVVAAMILVNNMSNRDDNPLPDVQYEGRLAHLNEERGKVVQTGSDAEKAAAEGAQDEAGEAQDDADASAETADKAGSEKPEEADTVTDEQAIVDKADGSVVKLETDKGDIYVELYETKTPITCGNFLDLVETEFYDGLKFHRVEPNFVIQGGDPSGDGSGGPGFRIPDEAGKGIKHVRGTLSMAKTAAPNSAGSQFYICHSPQPHLDAGYSAFGQCIKGMDVVDDIRVGDKIIKATILKRSADADAAIKQAKEARIPE